MKKTIRNYIGTLILILGAISFGFCQPPFSSTSSSFDIFMIGVEADAPYCLGNSVEVEFASMGSYNSGNTFVVQLSDNDGDFGTGAVTVGHVSSSKSSKSHKATVNFPASTTQGNKYRLRVYSTNPFYVGEETEKFGIGTAPTTSDQTVAHGTAVTLSAGGATNFSFYKNDSTEIAFATARTYKTKKLYSDTTFYLEKANSAPEDFTAINDSGEVYDGDGWSRRGVVVAQDYVYITASYYETMRFKSENLDSGKYMYAPGDIESGLFSDQSTGQLYTFLSRLEDYDYAYDNDELDVIRPLDKNLNFSGDSIELSQSIQFYGAPGDYYQPRIYSGTGFVIVYAGAYNNSQNKWFHIALPSGIVTLINNFHFTDHMESGNWAGRGYAKEVNGQYKIYYPQRNNDRIMERNVSTNSSRILSQFNNLDGVSSIAYSPWLHRLYYQTDYDMEWNSSGSGTMGYRAFDGGYVAGCREAINITVTPEDTAVGINEIEAGYINVYPNPTQGIVSVDLSDSKDSYNNIKVVSTLGQVVKTVPVYNNMGIVNIDLSGEMRGQYAIVVEGDNSRKVRRVVLH